MPKQRKLPTEAHQMSMTKESQATMAGTKRVKRKSSQRKSSTGGKRKSSNMRQWKLSNARQWKLSIEAPVNRLCTNEQAASDGPRVSLRGSLETTERVSPTIALRSSASITRATRTIHATCFETTLFATDAQKVKKVLPSLSSNDVKRFVADKKMVVDDIELVDRDLVIKARPEGRLI
ncbi:hypothetical protein GX50_01591 [[Emmonsia] crescens]|uniref:Uncharacterized protein n=1 Tax=[Emmonsia] crescens TaxID=73230 RepID=A0A2B7ZQN2_9EURO|nr:hypothetical protein GX50_01591 [Emmonsia crescens]